MLYALKFQGTGLFPSSMNGNSFGDASRVLVRKKALKMEIQC